MLQGLEALPVCNLPDLAQIGLMGGTFVTFAFYGISLFRIFRLKGTYDPKGAFFRKGLWLLGVGPYIGDSA